MQKDLRQMIGLKTNGDPVKLCPQDTAFLLSKARVAFLLTAARGGLYFFLAQLPIIYLNPFIRNGLGHIKPESLSPQSCSRSILGFFYFLWLLPIMYINPFILKGLGSIKLQSLYPLRCFERSTYGEPFVI
jgi:hypothetical protein